MNRAEATRALDWMVQVLAGVGIVAIALATSAVALSAVFGVCLITLVGWRGRESRALRALNWSVTLIVVAAVAWLASSWQPWESSAVLNGLRGLSMMTWVILCLGLRQIVNAKDDAELARR